MDKGNVQMKTQLLKKINIIQCPACNLSSYLLRGRMKGNVLHGIQRCISGHYFAIRDENGEVELVGDVVNIGALYEKHKGERESQP